MIPPAWADLPFWDQDWPGIAARLAQEPGPVYPPDARRFAALDACPPDRTRVVILGQDPYHTPGKADGLAFSIPQDFAGRLDSLGNILKELETDLGAARATTDLAGWAAQGVLLLNTCLSVPEGRANAHRAWGWDRLVQQVLARLDARPTAFLLWGKPAQAFASHLRQPHHLVLAAPHPSPLSAHRGFFGSRPFSRTNAWLAAQGAPPIDWAA